MNLSTRLDKIQAEFRKKDDSNIYANLTDDQLNALNIAEFGDIETYEKLRAEKGERYIAERLGLV